MKSMIIKWDESMAVRCLARLPETGTTPAVRGRLPETGTTLSVRGSDNPVQKTNKDLQWEDFENALNKALKK